MLFGRRAHESAHQTTAQDDYRSATPSNAGRPLNSRARGKKSEISSHGVSSKIHPVHVNRVPSAHGHHSVLQAYGIHVPAREGVLTRNHCLLCRHILALSSPYSVSHIHRSHTQQRESKPIGATAAHPSHNIANDICHHHDRARCSASHPSLSMSASSRGDFLHCDYDTLLLLPTER